jgi:hypothetical protein
VPKLLAKTATVFAAAESVSLYGNEVNTNKQTNNNLGRRPSGLSHTTTTTTTTTRGGGEFAFTSKFFTATQQQQQQHGAAVAN